MKYGTEYRGEWMMMDDVTIIRVSVFDTENLIDDLDPVTIIPVRMSGNPLNISIIDSSRDKFTQIKARQAKIEILTENGINLNTFSGSDNRWYVDIRINPDTDNKILFLGFLSLADMQVNFQPDPNVLVLTATDHLGMLKDIPLTDNDGENPSGKIRIAEYLSWIFKKTGLTLTFKVVNSLRHGSGTLTNASTFSGAGQYFVTDGLLTDFFYVGQVIEITDTTSNNGTRTVTEVDNTGLISQIKINATIVSETPTATFTDLSSGFNIYDNIYLDAKTFESEIGESEDCYTCLEKILAEDCFITQYNGEWWIVRVEELDEKDYYVTSYEEDGTYNSVVVFPDDYNKEVGASEDYKMAFADMLLESDRPHGLGKLTFNYQYPQEIPCNINFERGDYIEDLPNEIVEDETVYRKAYAFDCWDLAIHKRNGNASVAANGEGYIVKGTNSLDYEVDRYVEIDMGVGVHDPASFKSEFIPIEYKDRFNISVSYKWDYDFADVTTNTLGVELVADDGTYWYLLETGAWFQYPAGTGLILFANNDTPSVDFDTTEYQSISINSESAPRTGKIYIYLQQTDAGEPSVNYIRYGNLSFTYYPYINGSHQKYSGQYQKVSRDPDNYLAKREKEVYISDSPKPILKGGMYFNNGSAFVLTSQFFDHHNYPFITPLYIKPYGEHQIRSVFNQYRNANRVFNGSIQGTGLNWCDVIHKYSLTDVNPNTDSRIFMLTSFEQNWKTGYWTGQFIECWKIGGRDYSDDWEFKYITQ